MAAICIPSTSRRLRVHAGGVGFRQALQAGQPDAEGILANARKERARELV